MGKIKEFLKSKQSLVKSVIATIIFGVILSMGLNLAWAWVGPTAIAPGGNIAAPLNTGGTAQIKTGVLTIAGNLIGNGGITTNSLTSNGPASINGTLTVSNDVTTNGALTASGGITTSNITSNGLLTIGGAGGLTLGQDLNMNGKNIFGVNSIKGVSLLLGYWTLYDTGPLPGGNGIIEKSEAFKANQDFFDSKITRSQALEVFDKYNHDVALSYDANGDGIMQKSEAVQATVDYFNNLILKQAAIYVVSKYESDKAGSVVDWDTDKNGLISKSEAVTMLNSYFNSNGPTKDIAVAVIKQYYENLSGSVMEYAGSNGVVEKSEAARALNNYLFDRTTTQDIAAGVIQQYYKDNLIIYPSGTNDTKVDSNVVVNGCIKYNGGTLGTCK